MIKCNAKMQKYEEKKERERRKSEKQFARPKIRTTNRLHVNHV